MANIDKNDKLTDTNTVVDESTTPYFTDVYTPGETKEQLNIGDEVAKPGVFTGNIDTATISVTTDNIYNLSVANPDGKIFSIGINGAGILQEKTFKIGFFGNTPLAYSTLETELTDWLGEDYIVTYVSGTNYTIQRLDKQVLSETSPDLVRDITISNHNDDGTTKLDIIVDGVTVTLEGNLGGLDPAAYLESQLSTSLYYMLDDTAIVLTIARKDGAIPVITQTTYNRYTYLVESVRNDTTGNPISTNLGGSGGTSKVKIYEYKTTIDSVDYAHVVSTGLTWTAGTYNYTATNIANISDSNEFSDGAVLLDITYSDLGAGYTLGTINGPYGTFSNQYDYTYNRTNYAQSTFSNASRYVLDSGLSLVVHDTGTFTITETNHLASMAVTIHTEIAITLSLTSNNFFVPVGIRYTKIVISAISSGGSSEGIYELRSQSCTAKYGATTEVVTGKIFKTDANNYGDIVLIKRGGFVINFTTNTSNKLAFTCS